MLCLSERHKGHYGGGSNGGSLKGEVHEITHQQKYRTLFFGGEQHVQFTVSSPKLTQVLNCGNIRWTGLPIAQ